jgi:hypothetical protein
MLSIIVLHGGLIEAPFLLLSFFVRVDFPKFFVFLLFVRVDFTGIFVFLLGVRAVVFIFPKLFIKNNQFKND